MKNLLLVRVTFMALMLSLFSTTMFAQTVIYSEDMGTPTGTTAISANTFSNASVNYSGTADVRSTTPSNTNVYDALTYTNPSGGGNVYFASNQTPIKDFYVSTINTSGYINLSLSFALYKSLTTKDGSDIVVSVSTNGISYTPLSFAALPTGTGTAKYHYITITSGIPSTTTLYLKFENNSPNNDNYRLDDILLTGTLDSGDPYLTITSPTNNIIVNNPSLNVNFTVQNFVLGTDGKVAYKLEGENYSYTTDNNPIGFTLQEGENKIVLELVDMTENPLTESVTDTINVIYEILYPKITITYPTEGAIIPLTNVNIEYNVENLSLSEYPNGHVNYILDSGNETNASISPINLGTLADGNHTCILILYNGYGTAPENILSSDTVNFICAPMTEYTLVTSETDIYDGGRYLIVGKNANNEYFALGSQNTNNRKAIAVSNNANVISTLVATENTNETSPYEIILEQTNNAYALFDAVNAKYLTPINNQNYLKLSATPVEFSVSIPNGDTASIEGYDITSYNRPVLNFNNANNPKLFACYGNYGQMPVYLYKAEDIPLIFVTSPQNGSSFFEGETISITYNAYNTNGLTLKYTINGASDITTTDNPIILEGLTSDNYEVVLKLFNGNNELVASDDVNFTVTELISIGDNLTETISIYPNPANNYFTITASEDINTVTITNIAGQIVKIVSNSEIINTQEMTSGIYFVNVACNGYSKVLKLIIQ